MAGILIQLVISWVLLYLLEKENLSALGFTPTKKRLLHFAIGIFAPVLYFIFLFFLLAWLGNNPWKLNEAYTINDFGHSLFYLFKSVAFENLIFTGALLYILMKRIGHKKAILISAVSFGIYHWFSWNLFGQPSSMLVTFLTTGIAGYLWAYAFYKTKSVYLPFALHMGVNIAFSIVFSKDKAIGPQLLLPTYETDPVSPGTIVSIIFLFLYFLGWPIILFLYLKSIKGSALKKTESVGQNKVIINNSLQHDAV